MFARPSVWKTLVLGLPLAVVAHGEGIEFNRDIRPILSDKCFSCHGPDATKRKTKLRFDSEQGARIDLGNGHLAVVPGDLAKSELYQRIVAEDEVRRMPPASMGQAKLDD